jgi:hypothetical protein
VPRPKKGRFGVFRSFRRPRGKESKNQVLAGFTNFRGAPVERKVFSLFLSFRRPGRKEAKIGFLEKFGNSWGCPGKSGTSSKISQKKNFGKSGKS